MGGQGARCPPPHAHPRCGTPPHPTHPVSQQALLDGARGSINAMAEGWGAEERQACMEETPATFKWGGSLVGLITGGEPVGGH